MTDDRQWYHAVVVAQKSGRKVTCSTANGSPAEDAAHDCTARRGDHALRTSSRLVVLNFVAKERQQAEHRARHAEHSANVR